MPTCVGGWQADAPAALGMLTRALDINQVQQLGRDLEFNHVQHGCVDVLWAGRPVWGGSTLQPLQP